MKRTWCLMSILTLGIIIYLFNNIEREEERIISDKEEQKIEQGEAQPEALSESYKMKDAVLMHGKLSMLESEMKLNIEDYLPLYKNEVIDINNEMVREIISNLKEEGWGDYSIEIIDVGSYLIKGQQMGTGILDVDALEQVASDFMRDSGILELLNENEIEVEFKIEEETSPYTVYYFLLSEGQRTGSYIRMNFESETSCGEAMLYLYTSEVMEKVKQIPVEEALKEAFYIDEENKEENPVDNGDYTIRDLNLKYIDGVPYYNFVAYGVNNRLMVEGYALAVEKNV